MAFHGHCTMTSARDSPKQMQLHLENKGDKSLWCQLQEASYWLLNDAIADSSQLVCVSYNVPARLQDGPQCGIVSAWMAVNSLLNYTPGGNDHRRTVLPGIGDVQSAALDLKYTIRGEMFSASSLAHLINYVFGRFGIKASVEDDAERFLSPYDNLVKFFTDPNYYQVLLVPYDADRDQRPCNKRGHKAHWGIVTGIATFLPPKHILLANSNRNRVEGDGHVVVIDRGKVFEHEQVADLKQLLLGCTEKNRYEVICRQSKSRRLFLFNSADLVSSCGNLAELSPDRRDDYVIPAGGVEAGLARKCVIVQRPITI